MSTERAPAFQFYAREFLSDVAALTNRELGAYWRLCCLCWTHGGLPTDVRRLAHMANESPREFGKLWPALAPYFEEREGRLLQPMLERERKKQAEFRELQARKGRQSAASRASAKRSVHETRNQPDASRVSAAVQPDANRAATAAQPDWQPNVNSPISDLQSPEERLSPSESASLRPRPRSFGRIDLHRWQIDALVSALGAHAESFALDEWLLSLSERSIRDALVLDKSSLWPWVQKQFTEECRRRGLAIAEATAPVVSGRARTAVGGALRWDPRNCHHEPHCGSASRCHVVTQLEEARAQRAAS